MTSFMMVCPFCKSHVELLQIEDITHCPLCNGISRLEIKTVLDEPKMIKVRR